MTGSPIAREPTAADSRPPPTREQRRGSLLVVAVLASFIPVLSGCDKSAQAKEPGRFYGGFWDDFSIKFPQDWEVQSKFPGVPRGEIAPKVMALSPLKGSNDAYRENVGVLYESVPGNVNIDEYVNLSLQHMNKMLSNVTVLKQDSETIDDFDARRVTFTHSMMGMKLKGLCYIVMKDNRAYIVLCSSTAKRYGRYRRRFEEIAKSFRFE